MPVCFCRHRCKYLYAVSFLDLYHGANSLFLSVIVGTGTGLVVKYLLDKQFIFRFQTRDAKHEGKTFLLYSLMGVFTTLIFWLLEFSFHYLFGTESLRYLGATIGLVIGYGVKYYLDKRYVFSARQS